MAIRIHELGDIPGLGPIYPSETNRSQTGVVGASSVKSEAFKGDVRLVSIEADENCHVVFGADPTATTAGYRITAGVPREFATAPGKKVAWIQA